MRTGRYTRKRINVAKDYFSRCRTLKIGYPTKGEAFDVAESMMEVGRVNPGCHITAYLCKECQQWHVWNRPIFGVRRSE